MTSSENYAVACTKCSESKSSNDFEAVRDFAFKHQKHTGHPVDWTEANIDSQLSATLDLVYQVVCDECEEQWEFEEHEEAEEFHQEHSTVTDHTPSDIQHLQRGVKINKPDDLLKLIDRLNTRTGGENGAPYDIVLQAARHRGGNTKKVKRWVERLCQEGELYEPTPGYYRHV
jgi:hypothetical protein